MDALTGQYRFWLTKLTNIDKNMKKHHVLEVITVIVFMLLSMPAIGQDVDGLLLEAKQKLTEGQSANNVSIIMESRAMFERAGSSAERKVLAHYYVALASYRMATMNASEKEQLKYLDQSIEQLEKVIEMDAAFTEGYALLGSALGWKAGLKPMQSMFLGPRANKMVAKAKELQPENPRAIMIGAVSDYNTPKMFGGDPVRAMKGFEEAIALFEKEELEDPLMPAWGHEEAYAWLGQGHLTNGAKEQARAALEKSLEINPDYGWVKYVLLPKVSSATP